MSNRKSRRKSVVHVANPSQQTLELVDRAEAIAGIRKGLASMARGDGIPAEKAFEKLRKKHSIPRGTSGSG
jgi:hypothetical protein